VITKDYPNGNTENTIKFVKELMNEVKSENQEVQMALIWDGAPYHRSQAFRDYLEQVNQGRSEKEWLIKCIRLAPNAPEQNPIEDV
jgi:transposase